jgi:two-component system, chemotaxis family, chemotaxis protein CheY
MRILIVDDSPLVRRMYGLAFFRHKHELIEAENGRQALDVLGASEPFDLILLDLRMPDMNGVEFIRHVQRRPLFTVPIIVTTAEAESSELLQQARTLGVAAIVKKPWKPQELAELVQSVLERWHP